MKIEKQENVFLSKINELKKKTITYLKKRYIYYDINLNLK
jgi:hypothetical protein